MKKKTAKRKPAKKATKRVVKKKPVKKKPVKKKPAKRKRAKKKATRPGGRPRAITAEKKLQLLGFISGGGSRCKAAEYIGVCPSTIANEAAANPRFLDSLTHAEASCYSAQVQKITGADDWRAAGWYLARKYPEEFSEVQKVAQTDVQGRDLTDDQRKRAILAILREGGVESTTSTFRS